jgi:hypothetical protein
MESVQEHVSAMELETAVVVSQESSGLSAGHGALVALKESFADLEFEGEFSLSSCRFIHSCIELYL